MPSVAGKTSLRHAGVAPTKGKTIQDGKGVTGNGKVCESLRGKFPWATRLLILCSSKTTVDNALDVASHYLEDTLKFTLNPTKTHIAHSRDGVTFLGVEIYTRYTRIQPAKLQTFKHKVKQLTRRNHGENLAGIIQQLNPILRGFVNDFRIAN